MHHSHHHETNVAYAMESIMIEPCRALSSIDENFRVRVLSLGSVTLSACSIRPGKVRIRGMGYRPWALGKSTQ
jgi:hypothetical protein